MNVCFFIILFVKRDSSKRIPKMSYVRTSIQEQQKFHNVLAFLRLITEKKVHKVHFKLPSPISEKKTLDHFFVETIAINSNVVALFY